MPPRTYHELTVDADGMPKPRQFGGGDVGVCLGSGEGAVAFMDEEQPHAGGVGS